MKIISSVPELTFNDVLLLPGFSDVTAAHDIEVSEIKTKISKNIEIDIPICSSPMPSITETKMAITLGKMGGIGFIHCFQKFEEQIKQVKEVKKNNVKVAVSVSDFSEKGLRHVSNLLKYKADLICIETPHGFNLQTIEFVKKIKAKHPKSQVCVSLVVTAEATQALIDAGADSIRVGIGGGSHCTTRLVTGVGRPQLSAVKECYEIAKKYGIPIISDTGIESSGDISKAIAFGASAVMIGGLFAGTEECPGSMIRKWNRVYKFSAGMCSHEVQYHPYLVFKGLIKKTKSVVKKIIYFFPKKESFTSTYSEPFSFIHEGVSGLIPYKGYVAPIINKLTGGLKRSMWYLGSKNLDELREKTEVVVVTTNTNRDNIPRI